MLWGIYSAIYGEVNVSVEKCVEIKGDYVEKQQRYLFLSPWKIGQAGNFWTLLRTRTYIVARNYWSFQNVPCKACTEAKETVFAAG